MCQRQLTIQLLTDQLFCFRLRQSSLFEQDLLHGNHWLVSPPGPRETSGNHTDIFTAARESCGTVYASQTFNTLARGAPNKKKYFSTFGSLCTINPFAVPVGSIANMAWDLIVQSYRQWVGFGKRHCTSIRSATLTLQIHNGFTWVSFIGNGRKGIAVLHKAR